MEIVLSTYPGSFRLPIEVKYWLVNEKKAYHLFNKTSIEESNFALSVVSDKIEESNDFAGKFDDEWGYFNSNLVHIKDMEFYGLRFEVKSGSNFRGDEDLIEAIEKFEPDDFKIVDIDSESFKIETSGDGEFLIDTKKYYNNPTE